MTIKISAMSAATTLGGTEKIECVQSSATAYLTPAQIETYIAGLGRTFAKDAGLWWPLAASAVAVSCPADVTEDTLATITVPAGAMGANGRLRITTVWTTTSSANNKTLIVKFNGTSGTQYLGTTVTTVQSYTAITHITNRNSASSQSGGNSAGTVVGSSGANITSAVDTTASVDIVIRGQKASSGETLTLESYLVELYYKA